MNFGDGVGASLVPETILQQHVRERIFPDRKLRRRAPDNDVATVSFLLPRWLLGHPLHCLCVLLV